ncbi:MAG: hypothetical protein OXF05_06875 [Hyphomicrobiales bacterium]|nr:hypothetical protein [Hyphomicrobiales bacterium]MCY4033451.1 hypothetical protein [Hyphomicrobiales bacterium]MCY4038575.1 hypothetical protein [Hyphomicrobiales bacterium]
MKPLITTFAFALMVFAFNANPAFANEEKQPLCQVGKWYEPRVPCDQVVEIDEIQDQADNENTIADSGEEGSTSAAGATEQ